MITLAAAPEADGQQGWEVSLTVPGGAVECLATGTAHGRPSAVTGGEDGTLCVGDLTEGRLSGEPNTEHGKEVFAVRVIELDGRPVVVARAVTGRHGCGN